ncbi:pseudouridine synthase [Pseudemcibacter aquimaris]|uniref:pseudouridine synthase n=1 Tax=Pseudemcibacter aquimaris TaxID=2857064 RepID=UPI00201147AD|nr:pseudouridine synthase [Pseudemcibacter aquimaris]MCC3862026.1 bifunctional tRNA pseudouridine(32) synthase/ribosomal large subunit pseudouridine synthase RluA [Pseudemcibacter aquimaris]WDU58778.1 bifunctional tRNA pseudouridine(32) synthase/ribosomal large subunit pseudouridine synthase RluA [Pseudemcibacter aquimaris]
MPFIYNPPSDPFLEVIYQDDDILVLNKQAGLLTVPGKDPKHADCLETRAQKEFPTALTVHRLDMDTSGLIVMGLNKFAHRHLSLQFQNRNVDKIYEALAIGTPQETEGLIDLPLICDWPNRPKQMVDHDRGKPSQTKWQTINQDDDYFRVQLTPITGRSHQLRVHLMELGHPILGDRFYANERALKMKNRLCLHSKEVTIMHPVLKEKMTFTSKVPF